MNFEESADFDTAKTWAEQDFGLARFLQIWIPESHFLYVRRYEHGLLVAREDEGIYGYAFGDAPIPADWTRFSATRDLLVPARFRHAGWWQAHGKELASVSGATPSPVITDQAIARFLADNAPESSVKPIDPEILFWSNLLIEGELVGTAAVCTWQSGERVLNSVAIAKNRRGQGLGKLLLHQIEMDATLHGVDYLALGVRADNEAAKSLYRSSGYKLLHDFSYYDLAAAAE